MILEIVAAVVGYAFFACVWWGAHAALRPQDAWEPQLFFGGLFWPGAAVIVASNVAARVVRKLVVDALKEREEPKR